MLAEVKPPRRDSDGSPIRIRGGMISSQGRLSCRRETASLLLTKNQCSRLGLAYGEKVSLWYGDTKWRVGPYLGIMTSKREGNRPGFSGIKGRRENYVSLLRVGKAMGLVGFVFAYEDIDFANLRVTGYSQGKDTKWYPRNYPIPDVIYNRISDRPTERSVKTIAVLKRLERLAEANGLHMFNPHFLDKWKLYKILMKESDLREHLPRTVLYRSPSDIQQALKEHKMVYLKPRSGFAGKGIMRVARGKGGYTISVKSGGKYVGIKAPHMTKLLQEFQRHRSSGAYLVQEGLQLARFRGSIFDARVIVQKDGSGEWAVSGIGVRVAAKGGITTHVPNGGYIVSLQTILDEVYGGKELAELVDQRVKSLALRVATTIEQYYRKTFGELSMDIGLDQNGRCFFFEANAKPMKFDEPQIRKVTLRRLIDYTRFLSGYVEYKAQEVGHVPKKDIARRAAQV